MRPLEGIRVVAIEQAVAAPFATSRLADAGAEVIKIERPEGDFARGYDDVAKGQSSYFVWLNRGKSSVTLDLRTDAGRARLEGLLGGADVLVQNLKRGALGRLGFTPERLARDHPRLIACAITGYGEDGPMADRKAYDLLIQAESGLCSITGGPSEPARVGISLVDIATGATAHSAILEALLRRGATGQGASITISMFDVMADWLTVAAAEPRRRQEPAPGGYDASLDLALRRIRDRRRTACPDLDPERPRMADAVRAFPPAARPWARSTLLPAMLRVWPTRAETDGIVAKAFGGMRPRGCHPSPRACGRGHGIGQRHGGACGPPASAAHHSRDPERPRVPSPRPRQSGIARRVPTARFPRSIRWRADDACDRRFRP